MATPIRLTALPEEVIDIILDMMALQHILSLFSTRNKYLISAILTHPLWRGYFGCCLITHCDAIDLARTFDTMREAARFMRTEGPVRRANPYADHYWVTQRCEGGRSPWRVAPYAPSSERELSWDRSIFSQQNLLSSIAGQEKTLRTLELSTIASPGHVDYTSCRRADEESSMLQRFLDSIQHDHIAFATWSSAARDIPKLFRLLGPKVRVAARHTCQQRTSGGFGTEITHPPHQVALITAMFHEHMTPESPYCFITNPTYPYHTRAKDDSLVVMINNETMARLMTIFLLNTYARQCDLMELERRLHSDFVRMSIDALAFAMDKFAEFRDQAPLKSKLSPIPCTDSDRHLLVGHPDFWYNSARGALRIHKHDQLMSLAKVYAQYPLLLKLAGDRAWNARSNHAHIYQTFVSRAKRLMVWDPFKRKPHKGDTLDHSNLWLLPFDKHLDFMLRVLQAHPIRLDHVPGDAKERIVATVGSIATDLQVTLLDITADAATMPLNPIDARMHSYPEPIVRKLITIFGGFYEPREHGRNKIPWLRMSTHGKYRLGGRHDAECQWVPYKLIDQFRSGQRDVIWLRAFVEVLTYLKDSLASPEEKRRIFELTLPNSEHIQELRERRKASRTEKQQQRTEKQQQRTEQERLEHIKELRNERKVLEREMKQEKRQQVEEETRSREAAGPSEEEVTEWSDPPSPAGQLASAEDEPDWTIERSILAEIEREQELEKQGNA